MPKDAALPAPQLAVNVGPVDDPSIEHSLGGSPSGEDLPEVDYETEESESNFEKSIISLLPGFRSDPPKDQQSQPPRRYFLLTPCF